MTPRVVSAASGRGRTPVATGRRPVGVSLRAGVLGLILIPPNAYWLAVMELVRNTGTPTSVSLFFNAVFTLLVVVLANAALRAVAPRVALSSGELATVYLIVTLGSAMAGIDMFCCLPPMIAYPVRYATPENGWHELFVRLLPEHLIVSDREALRGFWEGGTTLYTVEHWRPWVGPTTWWMLFTAGLVGLYVALVAIFSPRWIEAERLTYPIAQLPAELSLRPRQLAASTAFRVGFAVSAGICLLNGLHQLNPLWPVIPVKPSLAPGFNIGAQIVDRPWNAVGALLLSFYPFAIGLGMLLPTRLSLSCWGFYLIFKAQYVLTNQAGSWTAETYPYTREQSFGAFVGLVLFALIMSRRYLAQYVRDAWSGASRDDRALSPRTSLTMLVVSFGCLIAFAVHAGMTLGFAAAFFALYAILSLSVTRIRAEMGVPSHELHLVGPGQSLLRWLGSRAVGPRDLTVSTVLYWFNRAYRSHPMPHLAEGLRTGERAGLRASGLVAWGAVAMLVGGLSSCWAILHLYYRDGAAAKWGPFYHAEWIAVVPYNELATVIRGPTRGSPAMIGASIVGVAVTLAAMAAHTYIPWWPLHPVGYAVSNAWAFDNMWFSILVAWCAKATVERYGGSGAVRTLSAFAFGLILGDYTSGSLWQLYGTAKGIRTYGIWT